MATRTITIALEAKVSGLVNGFKTASQAANDFGSKTAAFAEKNRQSMEGVGTAGLVAGGVLVAGFGKAVATFASFDKAMSSVQAATHESAENMELLSEAAITAGADTAYSAEEAAGAIEELAKAGIATTDILNGGLDGALALAAAGSLDVGEAAEFAASAMTQFGLKGSDIPHIADLLAAGAGKAQGSVRDMGLALSYAGVPAAAMGVSIEDTTGAIALFAKSGIIGEKAGTALRSMLVSMANPTEKTSKLMGELGITFEDAQGKFVGIDGAAQQLAENLGGLEEMERNSALAQIFGNEALGAAVTLYEQGAEGVNAMVDEVNDYGYATETASLMQNNLAGDLEKLGGAFDTVFLKAGSGANGSLRALVQTAEDFVDMIGEIPAPALSAAAGIAGVTGAALLGGGAFFTLAPRVFETVGHFKSLSTASPGLTGRLGTVAKGAGIAAAAFVALQIASELAGTGMDDIGTSEEFETAVRSLQKDSKAGAQAMEDFATATGSSLTEITGLGNALETVDLNGFLKGLDFVGSGFGAFDTEVGLAKGALKNLDESLAGLASGGNLEAAAEGFRYAATEGEKVGQSVEKVSESFPDYIEALRELANETVGGVSDQELLNWALGETPPAMLAAAAASEETAAAIGVVGGEAEETAASLEDIVEALFLLGEITMSSRESTAAFHDSLRSMYDASVAAANGTLGLGAVLNETATDFDLTTEAGAAANAAFQDVARSGMADVEAKAREGLGQGELQANLRLTYDSLVNSANGMGITGGAADDLARRVLGVPDNVDVNSWMSDAAKAMAQDTTAALNNVDGRVVRTYLEHYETTFRDIVYGKGTGPQPGGGVLLPLKAAGGRISDIPGYVTGGRINYPAPSDMSKDNVLGAVNGKPIALQGQEWIINGRSSSKYDKELAAINAGTFPKLPGYANGGIALRPAGGFAGVSPSAALGPRASDAAWGKPWDAIAETIDASYARVEDWVGFEDGSGWMDFFDESMSAIAGSVRVLREATDKASAAMEAAAKATISAAAVINATAPRISGSGSGLSGANLAAKPGESNESWRKRQSDWMAQLNSSVGAIKEGDIHEDGSGQIVLADGRKIELSNGQWKFVDEFKYGAPLQGRTPYKAPPAQPAAYQSAALSAGTPQRSREYAAPAAMTSGSSGSTSSPSIDYDRLAAAINSRPVVANLRIGNRDVAQANIQGRKELRLSTT